MRTTLTLDDDVLAAAKELARQQGTSVGEVISLLSRAGLRQRSTETAYVGRVPVFAAEPDAKPITSEMVTSALEDE